jgi:hypothetical protein
MANTEELPIYAQRQRVFSMVFAVLFVIYIVIFLVLFFMQTNTTEPFQNNKGIIEHFQSSMNNLEQSIPITDSNMENKIIENIRDSTPIDNVRVVWMGLHDWGDNIIEALRKTYRNSSVRIHWSYFPQQDPTRSEQEYQESFGKWKRDSSYWTHFYRGRGLYDFRGLSSGNNNDQSGRELDRESRIDRKIVLQESEVLKHRLSKLQYSGWVTEKATELWPIVQYSLESSDNIILILPSDNPYFTETFMRVLGNNILIDDNSPVHGEDKFNLQIFKNLKIMFAKSYAG